MGFWDIFKSKWAKKLIAAQVQIVELINIIVTSSSGGITNEEWKTIQAKARTVAIKLGVKW